MASICLNKPCSYAATKVRSKHFPVLPKLAQAQRSLKRSTRVTTVAQAAASSSGNSHSGHAFLHDFCMVIPYAGIALVGSVLTFLFGAADVGMQLMGAGAATGLSAILSLKSWKSGDKSTAYTLLSAGVSTAMAYSLYQKVQQGELVWLAGPLLAVSGALALFCVYNVLAGGNPPKKSAGAEADK